MAGTYLRAYIAGPVVVAGSSAFNIDGVSDQSTDPNTDIITLTGAGDYQPTFAGVARVAPRIKVTTTDIKTALDNGIWLTGFAIPQTTVYTTVDLYYTRIVKQGARAASVNVRCRVTTGMIIPRTLAVTDGKPATLTMDIIPIWDASTAPIVFTDSQSLPHSPAIDECWWLGPAAINGTTIDSLQGFSLDFGIKEMVEFNSGEFYPSFVGIPAINPVITFDNRDAVQLNTYGLTGTAQGSTDSLFYLQQGTKNGARTAAGSSAHISFSVDDGIISVGDTGGGNDSAHGSKLILTPTYDGSNAIIAKATTAAITI